MPDGIVKLEYDLKKDNFNINTNFNHSGMIEVIETFLRMQMGKGKDESKPKELDIYNIDIAVNLSYDSFTCNHNCGNKGLRDGILIHFLRKENKA